MNGVASLSAGGAYGWRRWVVVTVSSLFYAASLAVILITVSSMLGRFDWRFDLVAHFRPHLAIGSLLFALTAILFARYGAAFTGLTCCAVQLYLLLTAVSAPATTASGRELKVMSINVLSENRQHQELLDLIERERPDLLGLQEIDPTWDDTVRELTARYKYTSVPPNRRSHANPIFSQFPIVEGRVGRPPATTEPRDPTNALIATLDIDGRTVEFFNIHPSHPMSDRLWRWRGVYLDWIASEIDQLPDDRLVIVVGDWNLSPWSPWYQVFMDKTGLRDAVAINYAEPTRHPKGLPELYLLGVTIDHIAVSPSIAILESDVGPDIGSDHRPVAATIRLP